MFPCSKDPNITDEPWRSARPKAEVLRWRSRVHWWRTETHRSDAQSDQTEEREVQKGEGPREGGHSTTSATTSRPATATHHARGDG